MISYGWIDTAGLPASDILALYDAVHFGMLDYIVRHEACASLVEDVDPWDAVALYHVLTRAGVFDDPLSFNRFSLVVEQALWQGPLSFDQDVFISEAGKILSQLGTVTFGTEPIKVQEDTDTLTTSSWKEGDV